MDDAALCPIPCSRRDLDEGQADTIFLDPGDAAFANRGIFAITRRKCCGTKAGFSTSIAAPSGEIFRTMQHMTEPPDETKPAHRYPSRMLSLFFHVRRPWRTGICTKA